MAKSEIRSFFTILQLLRLTLSEYVLLVIIQLIAILSYSLMEHLLALNELGILQSVIWQKIACDPSLEKANRISGLFPPKVRYAPCHQGGLGLRRPNFLPLQGPYEDRSQVPQPGWSHLNKRGFCQGNALHHT